MFGVVGLCRICAVGLTEKTTGFVMGRISLIEVVDFH